MFELILGTHNAHKVIELRELLAGQPIQLGSLKDLPEAITVDETGRSFQANATLKAVEQAKHLKRWVLAEDSGLSVEALGGQPGVDSAIYAGKHGDDAANNAKLLRELQSVPLEKRDAAFHCHIVVADPAGQVALESHGTCRGRIALAESGAGGFGYDPLFVIPEYHLTFGELGGAVKNVLSHRSRALRALLPDLIRLVRADGHQASRTGFASH